jgi:hypothetical protein
MDLQNLVGTLGDSKLLTSLFQTNPTRADRKTEYQGQVDMNPV